MKVCFVNPTMQPRPIYVLAKRLADRGHECTIMQPSGGWQRYPAWDNVRVIVSPCRYVPEIRYTIPPLREQARLLEELVVDEGYDLIHVQEYFYLTALPPIWIKRRCGVPITLVNNALVGVSWRYGPWHIHQATKLFTHTVGTRVLRAYDRLFFLYGTLAQDTARLLGKRMPPYEIVPVGIDPDRFHREDGSALRRELGIEPFERVVLFVGRFAAVKRVEYVIGLAQRLQERDVPARTVIVGGGQLGNRASEKRYHQLAEPLGSRVIFTGPRDPDELRYYYSIADVVVQPSRSEALAGYPVLEGAACRVPSVVSDVGGTREVVEHGVSGYVFPVDDFDAFCSYVEELLIDDRLARSMGRRAQELVLSRFDWERIVDRYERAFRELVDGEA